MISVSHSHLSSSPGLDATEELDVVIFQRPTVLPAGGGQNSKTVPKMHTEEPSPRSVLGCTLQPLVSSDLQQHGSLPHQPPGHGESPGTTAPSDARSESLTRDTELERERERERTRERERPAWPVGNFNKRQSDFSDAIIIKILPRRLFV